MPQLCSAVKEEYRVIPIRRSLPAWDRTDFF